MKKITSVLSIIAVVTLCTATYGYAGPINKLYFEKHPTTLQDIKATYGEPIASQKLTGGVDKLTFAPLNNTGAIGVPFFLVKDGKVIDHGYGVEYGKAGEKDKEINALKNQITDIEKRINELEKEVVK